jgi:defect in organelle trafficking protein DotD
MPRYAPGISGLGILALLAGCAGVTPVPPDVATTGMPNSELALQKSMSDVHAAMAELSGLGVAPASSQPPVVAAELDRPVSLNWSGTLDAGVKTIADRIGYRMTVTAPQPCQPLVVAVNVTNVTALAAFQALGGAAGTAATVVVDQQHHLVEVDHHV